MVVAIAAEAEIDDAVAGVAPAVKERVAAFFADVTAGLRRPEQRRNAELYARGLMEAGTRKSLEPIVGRLGGGKVEYEALQHFLADSPWDPEVVDRAVAERVCAAIEPEAWVLDDTGVVKDGKHSPGVKRQYSGTLGKTGNCQVTVSLHAVGARGTVPLGFRLYLPEEWCEDMPRRRKAKIPDGVEFQTKPAIGGELVARAAGWKIRRAPVLGDQAYGNDAKLRTRLHDDGIDYVMSVGPECDVYAPETVFAVPERKPGSRGPAPSVPRADREATSIGALVAGLDEDAWQTVCFRDRDGKPLRSRFAFVRVIAANPVDNLRQDPREEWLIAEWPEGHQQPSDYWISNLPAATEPEQLARLARLRWMIELDYKQLKGELGLDHYEGRSYLGFHHHCTLVTAAHGFLTLERADPNRQRPA
jgi:SRSO17 transposase